MRRRTDHKLVLTLLGTLVLGGLASACQNPRDRERREDRASQTETRSGEVTTGEPQRVEVPRVETPPATAPRLDAPRAEAEPEAQARARAADPEASRARDAGPVARDPRFDAGRLSIVGSAADREKNLGLLPASADAGAGAAAAPPASPPAAAPPAPPEGPGVIDSPPPAPTVRQGAGRPGAGGDPYQ